METAHELHIRGPEVSGSAVQGPKQEKQAITTTVATATTTKTTTTKTTKAGVNGGGTETTGR